MLYNAKLIGYILNISNKADRQAKTNGDNLMKNILLGFLAAYTILITFFTYGMYHGQIASIQQACVERSVPSPVDYVTELQRRAK